MFKSTNCKQSPYMVSICILSTHFLLHGIMTNSYKITNHVIYSRSDLLVNNCEIASFSGQGTLHSTPSTESSYERKLLRIRERLSRLKRTTDSAALGFLSTFLDAKLEEKEKGKDIQTIFLFLPLSH